jgi:hypothetical protein
MAATLSAAEGSAALAQRLAREILAEGRFHKAAVSRPLHDVLREIGRFLESPLNAIGELVDELGRRVPGGSALVWAALALVVLIAAAALAARGTRRALREPRASSEKPGEGGAPVSADELERDALAAERLGRYAEAVRFRFRAGLLRLVDRDILGDARSRANAEVVRALGSSAFAALAQRFDEITYGGSAATLEDVQRSRVVWTRVLSDGAMR